MNLENVIVYWSGGLVLILVTDYLLYRCGAYGPDDDDEKNP
jgi:hypothetical protein